MFTNLPKPSIWSSSQSPSYTPPSNHSNLPLPFLRSSDHSPSYTPMSTVNDFPFPLRLCSAHWPSYVAPAHWETVSEEEGRGGRSYRQVSSAFLHLIFCRRSIALCTRLLMPSTSACHCRISCLQTIRLAHHSSIHRLLSQAAANVFTGRGQSIKFSAEPPSLNLSGSMVAGSCPTSLFHSNHCHH